MVATKTGNNEFFGWNRFSQLLIPSGETLPASACDESSEHGKVFYLNTASSGQKMYACEGSAGWKLQGKSVDPTNLIVKAPSADMPGAQALSSLGGGILKSSAAGVVSTAVAGVDYYNPSTAKLPVSRLETWDDSLIWDWDEFVSVQQSGNWKLGWYGQGTGSGYQSLTIPGEPAHPGIVRLTSGGSGLNDYFSLGLIANTSGAHLAHFTTASWYTSWQLQFLVRPGILNNALIRAGLMVHSAGHSPWPRITARYEHGSDTAWVLEVCTSSTTCATAPTSTTPVAGTWYNLVLSSPQAGTVQLSVNGGAPVCITSAATGCAQNEVAMPTSALTPVTAIGSTGTAGNRAVDFDRFDIRIEGVQQRY